jgi:hypothetical protein
MISPSLSKLPGPQPLLHQRQSPAGSANSRLRHEIVPEGVTNLYAWKSEFCHQHVMNSIQLQKEFTELLLSMDYLVGSSSERICGLVLTLISRMDRQCTEYFAKT